jgi:hypothetical protein
MAGALAAFERAAATSGLLEETIVVASERVRIRLAGHALAGYAVPALAHHRCADRPEPADLTIAVFDTRSTGMAMPPPAWPITAYTPTSEIGGIEGDRFIVAFNVGTGVLDLLDTRTGSALHWIDDAARHPAYDVSSPFRLLLHWWLRRRGVQFLHAGAVAMGETGLLLAGKGGSGKSTAAVACLLAGFDFLGDDYVLARAAPRPEVVNLYRSAKLEFRHLETRFGALASAVSGFTGGPRRGKAIVMLPESLTPRLRERAEVAAIVIPRITDSRIASLQPASAEDALRALIPSTCVQLTAARKEDLDTMAALARMVPTHTLDMGRDIGSIPGVLAGLIDRGGG